MCYVMKGLKRIFVEKRTPKPPKIDAMTPVKVILSFTQLYILSFFTGTISELRLSQLILLSLYFSIYVYIAPYCYYI